MINNLEINGRKQTVEVEKDWNLLYIIREVFGLTGTKCGCSDGACGACVVIMNGEAVRSCRISAKKLAGAKITTIEGVADGERLHPIQQAFIDAGAVQCGFCTPGMIMRAKALLDHVPDPTEEEIREALQDHVCRCGGYQKIIEAIQLAAKRMQEEEDGRE